MRLNIWGVSTSMADKISIAFIAMLSCGLVIGIVTTDMGAQIAAALALSAWVIFHHPLYDRLGPEKHSWARASNVFCLAVSCLFAIIAAASVIVAIGSENEVGMLVSMIAIIALVMSARRLAGETLKRRTFAWIVETILYQMEVLVNAFPKIKNKLSFHARLKAWEFRRIPCGLQRWLRHTSWVSFPLRDVQVPIPL